MEIDEAETFQQQALEIRVPDKNFDPTSQPQNGEDYLMHMLYERKQCPTVVVKKPQSVAQKKNISFKYSENQQLPADVMAKDLLPTQEWKFVQANAFLRTRSKVMILRQHLTYSAKALAPLSTNDETAWLKFCNENTPKLSLMLRINQRCLEQLLKMFSVWLKAEGDGESDAENSLPITTISESIAPKGENSAVIDLTNNEYWLGSWLYALLACLHLPLEPPVHSTLRDIARTCMRLRSKLESYELTKAVPYNLFIYIIGKVFDQYDLLEYV